jgi:Uma2 family endonuclease
MTRVAVRSKMSPDEFLAWEREQDEKHEYYDGEVFAMAGASPRHNFLGSRLMLVLGNALPSCVVLTSDQRVTFREGKKRYVYPDISVTCGPLEIESSDVLLNPQVVLEVLSSSTEQYDRGGKWTGYQSIPSLRDYVLVAQTDPRIEHYQRATDGTWTYRLARAGERITLTNGAVLDVDAIFARAFELPGDELPD